MLQNERYTGRVHWNTSKWYRKDPSSKKRYRKERPREEWITHVDESLRIVPDALWSQARARFRKTGAKQWSKAGGKSRVLLSGLLRCGRCDAHYIMCNALGSRLQLDARRGVQERCARETRSRRDRIARPNPQGTACPSARGKDGARDAQVLRRAHEGGAREGLRTPAGTR